MEHFFSSLRLGLSRSHPKCHRPRCSKVCQTRIVLGFFFCLSVCLIIIGWPPQWRFGALLLFGWGWESIWLAGTSAVVGVDGRRVGVDMERCEIESITNNNKEDVLFPHILFHSIFHGWIVRLGSSVSIFPHSPLTATQSQLRRMSDTTTDKLRPNLRSNNSSSSSSRIAVWACGLMTIGAFVCSVAYFAITAQTFRDTQLQKANEGKRPGGEPADWKQLRDLLIQEISTIDPDIALKLSQPSTAEWKALQWILIKDVTPIEQEQPVLLVQRFALAATFLHFDLPLNATHHECEWVGVECNRNLPFDAENTPINDGVTLLNFTLHQTSIAGTVPTSLAYVSPWLAALDLSRQRIQGTIPMACHTEWKKMIHLHLGDNQLVRLFPTSPLVDWVPWPQLQSLRAQNNILIDTMPPSVASWTNLRHLDVRGNPQLTGALLEYALPHWTRIETIEIAQTGISGSIPDDQPLSLPYLKTLVALNTRLSGRLPESLATATNLETLSLGYSETTPWTGTLPKAYAALTALQHLSLANMGGITGTLPTEWGPAWSRVQALNLHGSPQLTGPLPASWGEMTSLVVLRLSNTGITGSIPTQLGLLTSLADLSLYRTNLVGAMPEDVCDLRTEYALDVLEADCRSSDGAIDAPVTCQTPTCCTMCVRVQ